MQLTHTVRQVLRQKGPDVWSIAPEASVYEALQVMADKGIGALLVMSAGRPVGMLSERDYARKIILAGRSSKETKVSEIMHAPLLFVNPDTTVDECMRLMTAHRLRHLPVMDSLRLSGVVSIGDLVNYIISAQEETIQHLHAYVVGQYPG
jgi:CBS domain-containing protein